MSGMESGNGIVDRHQQYMGSGTIEANNPTSTSRDTTALLADYENIFGPAARDIKQDSQRHKRHQRWHLPDALKGHNQYLTDRIDGLITDATNSPFTRNILPYVYLENPDQKLKWNVYSFDEGIASRVPYEAAARVLPQSKRSFAGYAVRQGLAIAMEHNFMVSAAGRENFKNQLNQLVGSIQLTNDLDVHMALLLAPSYQKTMNEKYHDNHKTLNQCCRPYVDMFGFLQKIPNAMDVLIEDARTTFSTWGSKPPTFAMCNNALTTQLTMNPERTDYVTNGPDGLKRLAAGPDLNSYRGLQIINSRKFSMDAGTAPRDLLRRKVRVSEYYHIPWAEDNPNCVWEFYDQSRDSMFQMTWEELVRASQLQQGLEQTENLNAADEDVYYARPANSPADDTLDTRIETALRADKTVPGVAYQDCKIDIFILRPCIEHYMLGVIFGRGGTQELGATFWGQTELSCYDDAQHGIWGMSYKYHERAVVTNERNLARVFDVAFDGYVAGMGQKRLVWDEENASSMKLSIDEKSSPYSGPDMLVMAFASGKERSSWPNPVVFHESTSATGVLVQPESGEMVVNVSNSDISNNVNKYISSGKDGKERLKHYFNKLGIDSWGDIDAGNKGAGEDAISGRTNMPSMAFSGSMRRLSGVISAETRGSGHLGHSYIGCASVREGRGFFSQPGAAQGCK